MTAFVTLAGVYNTPAFRVERSREQHLHSPALEQFLESVEKRAFKIAQLALRNDDDALDAVQDAMMKLVQSYASRDSGEWRPLFYRILVTGGALDDDFARGVVDVLLRGVHESRPDSKGGDPA